MSTYTDIGDYVTKTSFEISKTGCGEWRESDGFAALELICADPKSMEWDIFKEAIPTLWKIEWPPENKIRNLYNYITNYAAEPKLTTCTDLLIEDTMKCEPFVEVGTLYKTEHYSFRCDIQEYHEYGAIARGSSIVNGERIPGFLLKDRHTFKPLDKTIAPEHINEFSDDLTIFVEETRK